nr:PREDICTED: uncharacterized protein LOC106703857 [Latimeria chalumnae]|eukprot:XP_014345002.1 PREDICTED: uncharacterized protein LOC106703857 [Latimeria chalumnae]
MQPSGEAWCEAEGLQSGEVSAAFYTSTSTDSEQGGATDPPAQDANFWGLFKKMAGVLALELSLVSETDRSCFMQVLQGRSVRSPLQIPLHDVVPATVLDIGRAPASVLLVNKRVDRRYLAPDGEGIPLSSHPSAESTVASAANEQARTQRIFSSAPPSQDGRRWDTLGKKVSSYLAHLAQYDHDLWDEDVRHLTGKRFGGVKGTDAGSIRCMRHCCVGTRRRCLHPETGLAEGIWLLCGGAAEGSRPSLLWGPSVWGQGRRCPAETKGGQIDRPVAGPLTPTPS